MDKKLKVLFIAALLLSILPPAALTLAAPEPTQSPKKILVLFSHYIGMPWDDLVSRGLTDVFSQKDRSDIELNIEYLDLSRNHSENYESIILRMLEARYGLRQPDIIISNLDFISDQTILLSISRLFSGAKIISMSNQAPRENRALYSGRIVSFYNEPSLHSDQLDLIKKTLPKVRRIYFVTGASPQEREDFRQAQKEFAPYKSRFNFVYYTGLPLEELLDRVRQIPENAAIIFSTYFRDINGNAYVPVQALELIHKNANAPIFGSVDTLLGRGIVGGSLTSAEQLGREAGENALSILDGIESVEIDSRAVPAQNMFDWRELQRWHISESQLPEDSIIRYRESSFFELYKWHLILGTCIVIIQSLLIGFLLVTLSKRKAAEKALSGSEKKYRRLVESLQDGIVSMDKNLIITGLNASAKRIFDVRKDELIGRPVSVLVPDDERETQQENIDAVMANDVFKEYEASRLRNDGTRIPVRILLSTLKNETDMTIGLVEIVRDISGQKQIEQEKAELKLALQQAQKMEAIGTLAGGIAHDFNNILTAMIGYTELMLLDVEAGTEMESNLKEVVKGGKRARDLVAQILTFARRDHEAIRPISVLPIAKEAFKMIRSTIPASIEIRQQLATNSLILADPVKLHQIFVNICVNATHAMKNGGILEILVTDVLKSSLPAELQTRLPLDEYLKIRISDTGTGIEEKNLGLIFEPYFTTKEVGSGTGLGLSVVHGIVKNYGGEIFVESTPGQGTVFTIYFPVTHEKIREESPGPSGLPRGSEHILVVDDEPSIIKMMSQFLTRLGYKVTSRTSSADALAIFQKTPNDYDLIFTDMTMPTFCGDVLAREIKKIRPDIPIILCSGYNKKLSEEKPDYINAILMKPVEHSKLACSVRDLLDNGKWDGDE